MFDAEQTGLTTNYRQPALAAGVIIFIWSGFAFFIIMALILFLDIIDAIPLTHHMVRV